MKKTLLALLLVAALAAPAMAQESPLSMDAGAALTWSQRFDTGIGFADVFLGLRGGAWGDLMFSVSDMIQVGGELGMYYMSWEATSGSTTVSMFLGDFPLQAKASFILGPVSLDVLGGALFSMDIGSSLFFQTNALGGARLCLGNFYAEADYLMNLGGAVSGERTSYPRFALGYRTSIF